MFKTNEDCFYFLTSTCAKGPSCTYRHSPLALTCNVICQKWVQGNCPTPTCPFRHSSTIPRSSVGVPCFYENTATGCLKPECTFIHSRPRANLKNSPTIQPANLIKNETTKPIVNTSLPTTTNTSQNIPDINSTPKYSDETIPRRIAVSTDTESSTENNNNLTTVKTTNRSVIANSPKADKEEEEEEEPTTPPKPRLVVNRTVIQSSSNRIVVASTNTNSLVKEKVKEQTQLKRNHSPTVSPKKQKTSAGTSLSKDEERRTMRLERFQKQAVLTSSPVQPRFTAQPITAPSVQQPSSSTEILRPQQAPPSVVNQRPLTSVTTNKEDQNDSADIVDTFALIDEVLLETDDLV